MRILFYLAQESYKGLEEFCWFLSRLLTVFAIILCFMGYMILMCMPVVLIKGNDNWSPMWYCSYVLLVPMFGLVIRSILKLEDNKHAISFFKGFF